MQAWRDVYMVFLYTSEMEQVIEIGRHQTMGTSMCPRQPQQISVDFQVPIQYPLKTRCYGRSDLEGVDTPAPQKNTSSPSSNI